MHTRVLNTQKETDTKVSLCSLFVWAECCSCGTFSVTYMAWFL